MWRYGSNRSAMEKDILWALVIVAVWFKSCGYGEGHFLGSSESVVMA